MLERQLSPLRAFARVEMRVSVLTFPKPIRRLCWSAYRWPRAMALETLSGFLVFRKDYVQSIHRVAEHASQAQATRPGDREEFMTGTIGTGGRPIEVLLVEDSPGDVRLTEEAFRDANGAIKLHVACDGVEAMRFLRHKGSHAGSPRPDLILLDLNLPRMDGREVLAHIKDDEDLKTIPTVILTTSESEVDIVKSYQLQANCYLCKPVQLEAFEALVKSINDFWLTTVHLPPKKTAA